MTRNKFKLVLVLHNVRSALNVGSIFRTADGLGVSKIYLTGYTPYPLAPKDIRLAHVSERANREIAKTALGAEKTIAWEFSEDIKPVLQNLRTEGYVLAALEQSALSKPINAYTPINNTALIAGSEVDGLSSETLDTADIVLEIPMHGQKESFNVAVAVGIALYQLGLL